MDIAANTSGSVTGSLSHVCLDKDNIEECMQTSSKSRDAASELDDFHSFVDKSDGVMERSSGATCLTEEVMRVI